MQGFLILSGVNEVNSRINELGKRVGIINDSLNNRINEINKRIDTLCWGKIRNINQAGGHAVNEAVVILFGGFYLTLTLLTFLFCHEYLLIFFDLPQPQAAQ